MTDARAARAEEVCFQSRSSLTLAASHTWCGGGGGWLWFGGSVARTHPPTLAFFSFFCSPFLPFPSHLANPLTRWAGLIFAHPHLPSMWICSGATPIVFFFCVLFYTAIFNQLNCCSHLSLFPLLSLSLSLSPRTWKNCSMNLTRWEWTSLQRLERYVRRVSMLCSLRAGHIAHIEQFSLETTLLFVGDEI